jgi:Ran GTPase-activating protein (RanGAP) involved in mRNA processing and transport
MLKSVGWKKETELEKSVKRLKANDPSLTELNLYYNSIGDDGAKAIAEALKDNTVLTTLYLGYNSIGDDGAKAIAEALKVNTVLTSLDLRSNLIGDDGAKAIAEALKDNYVLTTLDLDNNRIGDSLLNKIQRTVEISKHVPKPDNIDDNVFKCFRDLAAALIWEETTHIGVDDIKARLKDCPEAAKAQDRHGNTLLHLGMKVWAPVEIINAFLEACLKR